MGGRNETNKRTRERKGERRNIRWDKRAEVRSMMSRCKETKKREEEERNERKGKRDREWRDKEHKRI